MKKNIYLAGLLMLSAASASAQYNMGVATGNWSATNALYLNPANIASSHEKISIMLLTGIAGVDNSLGTLNTSGGLIDAMSKGNTNNIFNYSGNSTASVLAPYAEVRGPGLLYSISKRHTVALTTRVRGMNQFNNVDQSLFHAVADPNFAATGNVDITSRNFNYTAHVWSEIGLSYGGLLIDNQNSTLRAGVTLRYLGGIGYISLKGNNVNAHLRAGNDSFYAYNSDIEYASNIFSTGNALSNGFSNNSVLHEFFTANAGRGIGGDLGISYEYKPDAFLDADPTGDGYLLRASAAVLDFGSILYNGSDNAHANVTGNGYITGQGIVDNVRSFQDFRNYAVAQGFAADTAHRSTRVYLPTRLLVSLDYNAYKRLYVNAALSANLADRNAVGTSFYNQFTLTPRYDTRLFSVGVPITYSVLSDHIKVGVGARFSGFFVGSDDLLALVSAKGQYGFNMYVGGYVPFYRNRSRDRDGDGIPDLKDKCPDQAGTLENEGCPQTDFPRVDPDDDGND